MEQNEPQYCGQIILLNGASSSGKSSIARELQRCLPAPYLHLSIDHLRDSGVLPLARFRHGEFAWADARENFFVGFERAVAAFARAGNNLIVDYIVETDQWMRRVEEAFDGIDVLFVGVHCPVDELDRREAARGDRRLGDARRDFLTVHQHCDYDLEVDATLPPEVSASNIVGVLQSRTRD